LLIIFINIYLKVTYTKDINLINSGGIIMKPKEKREWTEENYLANGHKTQNQWAKNKLNTTIKEPGMNESGIEAKKKGY